MIDILYFARVREQLGSDREQLELPQGVGDVAALIERLVSDRAPVWREVLLQENLLVAVNQVMAARSALLRDGDEVAFFPPVSGG